MKPRGGVLFLILQKLDKPSNPKPDFKKKLEFARSGYAF